MTFRKRAIKQTQQWFLKSDASKIHCWIKKPGNTAIRDIVIHEGEKKTSNSLGFLHLGQETLGENAAAKAPGDFSVR